MLEVVATGLRRTFRTAPAALEGSLAVERAVDSAEVQPLVDDFQERLLRLTPADARPALFERFEDPATVKVVWRAADRRVFGAALALVEGRGADIVLMHALASHATAASTGRLLDELLRALPPEVARVRALDRFAHRWLHLPPAETRELLLARGFAAFDRVLLTRDLTRSVPPAPPLAHGYTLAGPDPSQVGALADFAYRAYRGTTDFSIITPDASPRAYEQLYRRFLSGELGDYAAPLSLLALAPDGSLAAALHTILVAREPYVGDLSVLGEHRRRGLGRCLLLQALGRYRDAGHKRAGLTVTAQNTAAYNLYRSAGFEPERSGEVFLLAR